MSKMLEDSSAGDDPDEPLSGADDAFGFGARPIDPSASSSAPDPLVGEVVGGVLLERLIGEGGMGRVYLGRQLAPDRAVAVKLVRPGIATAAVLRRFERESESLARLRHPAIASIYVYGTCPIAGVDTPYFVMEYVPWPKPITDFANAHGLSARDRLELFRRVCEAVCHAHSRGVLHRDIKPANILVDEEGQPKLIDFGVARHLDRDTILTTGFDDIGRLVGTIQYMAPEQFQGDSSTVGMRADVYSLGVVLYELLAGRPPFDLRQAVLAHAARVVLEEEPPPLSAFNGQVGRDIGHVVRKCLEKDPWRRYSSVFDLESDIGRYLMGEPVIAQPAPLRDWWRRVWRRHTARVAFGAGMATLACALGLADAVRALVPTPRKAAVSVASAVALRRPEPNPRVPLLDPASVSAADVAAMEPVNGRIWIRAERLTPEIAEALALKPFPLTVALDQIDAPVARALSAHLYGMTLVGIRHLDDDVAEALSHTRGDVLNLDAVKSLSAAACASLARYPGWLNLNGVDPWPEGGLERITTHVGGLSLRIDGLSVEQARILSRHNGHLYVLGIRSLDEDAALQLLRHPGRLDLEFADGITPAAAAILTRRSDISFPGRPETPFPSPVRE